MEALLHNAGAQVAVVAGLVVGVGIVLRAARLLFRKFEAIERIIRRELEADSDTSPSHSIKEDTQLTADRSVRNAQRIDNVCEQIEALDDRVARIERWLLDKALFNTQRVGRRERED